MSWVKLDDGFFNNQKVVSVSKDAKLIYLAGICYSGATLTDGFVPRNAVAILAAQCDIRIPAKAVAALVETALWKEVVGGYQIHDYLKHNESAENVRAKQDAARERIQRNRSQNVRANNPRTSREVHEPDTDTDTDTELTTASAVVEGADAPTPPKAKRKTQVPADFGVTDALEAWAGKQTPPVTVAEMQAEIPAFIDYYQAHGKPMADWHATFQNWMRRNRKWAQERTAKTGGDKPTADTNYWLQRAQELREQDDQERDSEVISSSQHTVDVQAGSGNGLYLVAKR